MLRVLAKSRNLLFLFPQLSQKERRIKVSCPCLQKNPDKRGHLTRIVIQSRTLVTYGYTNEASIRKNETMTVLYLILKPLRMMYLNHPVWLKIGIVRRWSPPRPTLILKIKMQKNRFKPVILPLHRSQGATRLPAPSPKINQGVRRTLRAGQITCVA
jgi:hypothetical protein